MKNLLLIFLFCLYSVVSYSQVSGFYKKNLDQSIRNKFYNDTISNHKNVSSHQRTCHTMEVDSMIRKKYPHLGSLEDFEKQFQLDIQKQESISSKMQGAIYTIPVIVHIIHNGQAIGIQENITAAQVQSQIDVLNEDFRKKNGTAGYNTNSAGADVEIEFVLALYDLSGKLLAEPGIHRINAGRTSWNTKEEIEGTLKSQTIWDPNKYFNFWVVKFGGDMKSILGYAQFPNLSGLSGLQSNGGVSSTDGVVCGYNFFGRVGQVSSPYNGGRTMTHETGHWLGLRHIWGDVNDCGSEQDYCDDTPKAKDKNFGCPTGKNSCFWAFDGNDMIENYMDYTDDACMSIFTKNQKTRMRTVMEVSPRRKNLLSSAVHLSTNKPIAFFSSDKKTVCSGSIINFLDSTKNSPTSWQWDFYNSSGTNVGTFTNKNQPITFNTAGIYDVRLIVSNTVGKDTLLKRNFISVVSNTALTLPFNETVETYSTFPNWIFFNPDKDTKWAETSTASAYGVGDWSFVFDNYDSSTDLGGKIDGIISNKLNLSSNQNVEFSFDVAYAQFSSKYNDTLVMYYSVDCGQTFKPFWFKGGSDLATAPNTTSPFTPTSSEWRTENISLKFLNGYSSVYIAISNLSGWGNKLYIDNVKFKVPKITEKPYVLFNASSLTVCEGGSVQFNDISNYYPTTWAWEFTGGTPVASSWQNPRVKYNIPGTYDVKLTGTNNFGSDNWLRAGYINVVSKPTLNILSNKTAICNGDSIQLTASGGQDYIWYDDRENEIGNGNSIWIYPTINNSVKLIGKNSYGCTNSVTKSFSVNSIPSKPTITQAGGSLEASLVNGSYQWYSNVGAITGAIDKIFSPTINGTYYVIVTSSNNCVAKSEDFVYIVTSTDEMDQNIHSAYVFPNPNNGEFQINLPSKFSNSSVITISDLGGKIICQPQLLNQKCNLNLKITSGFYILEISDGANFIIEKLIIY